MKTDPNYQNTQLFCECQIVSLWNAARFWGLGSLVPKMGTRRYKDICRRANAIYGGVINIDFEAERLGLAYFPIEWDKLTPMLPGVSTQLPCVMNVFCERGYHSVLAVAHRIGEPSKPWTSKFLMLNWRRRKAWIPWGEILTSAHIMIPPRIIAPKLMIANLSAAVKAHRRRKR